jgi:HAMP domain-containing protein/HPt (histidine-containing phosphotransfer) domain-containing protein
MVQSFGVSHKSKEGRKEFLPQGKMIVTCLICREVLHFKWLIMKHTIWSKLLLFVVIPFIVVFGISSVFVIHSVFRDKTEQAQLELGNLVRFNELSLQSYIETIRLSVMIAAAQLDEIDTASPDARELAEKVILASFENKTVFNSWLIFEPNAFDGRDKDHKGEYSGETSGRFMRSYFRSGYDYAVAPDMYENALDDIEISNWYIIPKTTKKPYIDINAHTNLLWDYGAEAGWRNSLSIVSPIIRDGEFIGCVGQDILLNDIVLGPEIVPGAVSALFSRTGIVRYYRETEKTGLGIEELGFVQSTGIRYAFSMKEELFLSGVNCPLLGAPAFTCFAPVDLEDFSETAYIYVAIPESIVRNAVAPVLGTLLWAFIIAVLIFTILLVYFRWSILRPVHRLTLACEAISQGNLDGEIALSLARDEIGIMSRSLRRMVEQFRLYIAMQEQSKELLEIFTRLNEALYVYDRMEDVFDETIALICDYFRIFKASLILISGESARLLASFERGSGLQKAESADEFLYHSQVETLLAGRKYVSLNADAMLAQKIGFVDERTLSLCLLPFMATGNLRGYIIMEGDIESGPLIHNDAALLFISETVSYMLTKREAGERFAPRPEAPHETPVPVRTPSPETGDPEKGLAFLEIARAIEGLNVERGIFLAGGVEEQYGDLLRISAKVFTDGINKMRPLCNGDLPGFAIEVHGMKGALYAIGADSLGDLAKELELAAKDGNAARCAETYPSFEEKLALFAGQLGAITKRRQTASLGPGDKQDLVKSLKEALEASRLFNSSQAGKIIGSLLDFQWEAGSPGVASGLEAIADSLENINYDEAEKLISALLESLGEAV